MSCNHSLVFDKHVTSHGWCRIEFLANNDKLNVQDESGSPDTHREPEIKWNVQRLNCHERLALLLLHAAELALRHVEQLNTVNNDGRMLLSEYAVQMLWQSCSIILPQTKLGEESCQLRILLESD